MRESLCPPDGRYFAMFELIYLRFELAPRLSSRLLGACLTYYYYGTFVYLAQLLVILFFN